MCTDRGTEMGLVEAEGGNIVEYATPWLNRGRLELDIGNPPVGPAGDVAGGAGYDRRLLPNAVLSAGFNHLMHNIELAMDERIPFWNDWLSSFKTAMSFLARMDFII